MAWNESVLKLLADGSGRVAGTRAENISSSIAWAEGNI